MQIQVQALEVLSVSAVEYSSIPGASIDVNIDPGNDAIRNLGTVIGRNRDRK